MSRPYSATSVVACLAMLFVCETSAFSVTSSPLLPLRISQQRVCSTATRSLAMKLDVAPQVIQAFPTAEEQNECLSVVNAAVEELNKSDKSLKEMGRAGEVTYIVAAGRPQPGIVSARFNCKFTKGASAMTPGFVAGFNPFGNKNAEGESEPQQGGGARGSQVAQVNVQYGGGQCLELIVDVDSGWGRRVLVKGNFGGATW